jgi:hypothetical protein
MFTIHEIDGWFAVLWNGREMGVFPSRTAAEGAVQGMAR